ncbi:MAG: hypothetical protein RRC34_16250 [Lentisphaeria bacterium]|nr:hypothetical protein [Lentisphaeria bacterium]
MCDLKLKYIVFSFAAVLALTFNSAYATNPASSEVKDTPPPPVVEPPDDTEDCQCPPCNGNDKTSGTTANCIKLVIPLGACESCGSSGSPGYAANDVLGKPVLFFQYLKPTPVIFSPQGLHFYSNINSWITNVVTDIAKLPEGIARSVTLRRPNGEDMVYYFKAGSPLGVPPGTDGTSGKYVNYITRLKALDANGDLTTGTPVYYERQHAKGRRSIYNASSIM